MNIQQALKNAGHQQLLPIQSECIDAFQKHPELLLLSATGSGKTLAFLLSALKRLDSNANHVQFVILSPTRELCIQINTVFKSLRSGYKATMCYGGHSMRDEKNSLKETPAVVIATPGRMLDHLERGNIDLDECHMLIIDEFDKCLEFGFKEEMDAIQSYFLRVDRKLLVSATEPDDLSQFIDTAKGHVINRLEEQSSNLRELGIHYTGELFDTLVDTLQHIGKEKSIVFCNYREVVDDLTERLKENGLTAIPYHGGQEQDIRERSLIKYRNGSSNTLICTDLGARGLDIPEVQHVLHYQYPGSEDAFTHRKGRTARMSADGSSYLFIHPEKQLPEYIETPELSFKPTKIHDARPDWKTLYFSGGKKEKINKIDLVGFLSKKGQLKQDEIGLISVLDHSAYVAVSSKQVHPALKRIRGEKIKGKRLKIAISK